MAGLCLSSGVHAKASAISMNAVLEVSAGPSHVCALGRSSMEEKPPRKVTMSFPRLSFKEPFANRWAGGSRKSNYNGMVLDDPVSVENRDEGKEAHLEEIETGPMGPSEAKNGDWVSKILHVRSLWSNGGVRVLEEELKKGNAMENDEKSGCDNEDEDDGEEKEEKEEEEGIHGKENETCLADFEDEDEKVVESDRDSFSRLLRRVSLNEARLYAKMSYLGSLAYSIPKFKTRNPLRYLGLSLVTSSVEKKELAMKAEKSQESVESQESQNKPTNDVESKRQKIKARRISSSVAYEIAASAASYLRSHTSSILPFKSRKVKAGEDTGEGSQGSDDGIDIVNSEMASLMATTDSVTAVVAAKEEVKQAVADSLNSTHSSPCEWFICDEDRSGTRFLVIQGSESLASWQANLLFEPVEFEGLDVLVHRGIYEAAKGLYALMLPEVRTHLESRGHFATFRFTGHSLGGSLALLVNLMLLTRNEVPSSSLLPVITFGSPFIMYGGDLLLRKLGLPRNHVQAVTMHRDIVPRAFSCRYPDHIVQLLKVLNGKFRHHPCLKNQKILYAPMGELLILQPDEKFSPNHRLLPSGSGLYLLNLPTDTSDAEQQLLAAQLAYLDSPHPLEILSDRSAFGSEGSIKRDHDMHSYLKSVQWVIRQELNSIRKAKRERRLKVWWPILAAGNAVSDITVGMYAVVSTNLSHGRFNFSGMLHTGREYLDRLGRFVALHPAYLFLVFLLPARFLLLRAYRMISFF